jgi:GT2 family glycosyltransferase
MSRNRKHRAFSTKPEVDVVIVTGGRWDFLKECLEALEKQTIPINVILLDNASDAEERIQNTTLFDGVQTKRLQQSLGFPAANNDAVRMGNSPLILFLNDDCILSENAVEKMVGTMRDESIGICGAKLTFPTSSTSPIRPAGKVQHIGMALNIRGDVIHPLVGWSADNPRCCISRDVFCVTGACLMTRRTLFSKIGGFDTSYGQGTYEDVQFCLQVRSLGLRVFVNCEAKATHYAGATAEKKQVAYPMQLNSLTFKSRFLASPLMAWGTPDNKWVGEFDYY